MFPSPIATRDEGKVYRVVSGAGGRLLALIMDTIDGEVRLLDGSTLASKGKVLLGAMRTARACSLDTRAAQLAVATHDDVRCFDLGAGVMRWVSPLLGDEPALAFSPEGARIAASTRQGGFVLLDARDGTMLDEAGLPRETRALAWDVAGLVALQQHALVLAAPDGEVRVQHPVGSEYDEAVEMVLIDETRIAIAGTSRRGVWLELRDRRDARLLRALSLQDDRHAEGLAFAGGVLFLATEGGVYRSDPPFEQLVRWLPPMGGAHDPTRVAALADAHLAIVARDLRVYRTRS